jgi:ketosteroid isomerase-like protein
MLAGCSRNTAPDDQSGAADLQKTITAYYQSIEKDDANARAGFYADDAMMMPNGWDIVKGKDEIRKIVTGGGDSAVYQIKDVDQVELKVSGGVGYTVIRYSYSFNYRNQPPQWRKSKGINIWLRQPDGSWKLHADLWNSSVPRGN